MNSLIAQLEETTQRSLQVKMRFQSASFKRGCRCKIVYALGKELCGEVVFDSIKDTLFTGAKRPDTWQPGIIAIELSILATESFG